ncbi:carbon-nitrogen hydrolase, partial [bacterium]|nr:carbon-nitrogen hydrolase [bacterium]
MKDAFILAVTQFNPAIADLKTNRDRILADADEARKQGAKILVTGELALSGYMLRDAVFEVALRPEDSFLDPFRSLSREMTVIVGMAEVTSDHFYYNSALVFEDGEVIHRHRKVYLPNYGMFEEKRFFAEGDRIHAFDSRLGRLGVLVCNDMWHPMTTQLLGWDGAEMILAATASPTRGVSRDDVSDNTRVWRTFNRSAAKAVSAYVVQANLVGFQESIH